MPFIVKLDHSISQHLTASSDSVIMLSSSSVSAMVLVVIAIMISYSSVDAYSVRPVMRSASKSLLMSTKRTSDQDERVFRVEIPLGEGYQSVITNFRPIFAKSTIFVTTYDIPFSLNVEKAPVGDYIDA